MKAYGIEDIIMVMYGYVTSGVYVILDGREYAAAQDFYRNGKIENNSYGIDTTSMVDFTKDEFYDVFQRMILEGKIVFDTSTVEYYH